MDDTSSISPLSEKSQCNGEQKRSFSEEEDIQSKRFCEDSETGARRKLRKFVLLLSYCGKGYLGMQRNPGFSTIEDELLMAMLKSDLITEEVATCPQIFRFQRAARTDKGVSAARQIVSIKLPDVEDIPNLINSHLPEAIRVMKAVRVTQKFDAKNQCDSRSYSYTTPTFAFAPLEEFTNEQYRITPEVLEKLRDILSTFKGTHRFHNFTARVKSNDAKAQRYIMNIECSDPFIRNNIEWVKIKIKGQSFMLHQIRKMVGLSIVICRGFVQKDAFVDAWKRDRCDIPIAPGLGLVLEEPHYEYYNKKFLNDGIHEQLAWDSLEDEIEAFRQKYIDSVIVQTEIEEKVTLKWLQTLFIHSFGVRKEGGDNKNDPMGLYKARGLLMEQQKTSDSSQSNDSITDELQATSDVSSQASLSLDKDKTTDSDQSNKSEELQKTGNVSSQTSLNLDKDKMTDSAQSNKNEEMQTSGDTLSQAGNELRLALSPSQTTSESDITKEVDKIS